jgi:cytoskeleton-associated protein 5
MGACDPGKAFPMIAAMIADKDSLVRKAALNTLRSVSPRCIHDPPLT